jgi:MFS family permease
VFHVDFPFRPSVLPFHYGWLLVAAATTSMIASIPGQTIGVNVFADELIGALKLTRTEVSLSYLVGTALSGCVMTFAGRLYDSLGARRMIVFSTTGLGVSLFYMSRVDYLPKLIDRKFGDDVPAEIVLIAGLALGFFLIRLTGQGFIMMAGRNVLAKWWKYHRGKVLPITGIGVTICFSLAPRFFDHLIEQFDWRVAWQILGLALFIFAVFFWLVFRDNPEECGLSVDAGIPPSDGQKNDPELFTVKDLSLKEALGQLSFYVVSGVFALQALYTTAYTFHVVSIAQEIGVEKSLILNLFLYIAVLGAVISIVIGWLSDRFRLKYFVAVMAFGMSLSSAALFWRPEYAMFPLLILGMAISTAGFGTVSGVFVPRYFGIRHIGAISGVVTSIMVMASAIGPYLFSQLRDRYGSYDTAYAFTLVSALSLLICCFWADSPQHSIAARRS